MNLAQTLRGLARRWYIVVPGIILAAAFAVGAWNIVPPSYERTATQMLLPGSGTLPEGASNPYLYLGGLTAPADVLVRAVGSGDELRDVIADYPGSEVEVTRDPSAAGPVILITVTARSDADAAAIVDGVVKRTSETLADLQNDESIRPADRITIRPLSQDDKSTLQQRSRLLASVGIGVATTLVVILIASVTDGLVTRSRRSRRDDESDEESSSALIAAIDGEATALSERDPEGPDPSGDSPADAQIVPVRRTARASTAPRASSPDID